jgi:hypothetical protein
VPKVPKVPKSLLYEGLRAISSEVPKAFCEVPKVFSDPETQVPKVPKATSGASEGAFGTSQKAFGTSEIYPISSPEVQEKKPDANARGG